MKKATFLAASAIVLSSLFSCNKTETPVVPQEEETVSVEQAVDVLTKSITREDLQDLSLFIKQGTGEQCVYIEIEKEGDQLVAGEVCLEAGENYKVIGLNLMVMSAIPVTGTVDQWKLALYMAEAQICKKNVELLGRCLEKANTAIDVQVMYMYHIELVPELDEESCSYETVAYLVDNSDPESRISINALIAMFS